jgi:hypothetical protein
MIIQGKLFVMRIENGKLIYEQVTCWHCEGRKVLKEYDSCPLYGKKVAHLPHRMCPHCGATNKHSHHALDTFKINPCYTCEATGVRMEDSYELISQEQWNKWVAESKFTFEVIRAYRDATFVEQYIGDPRCLYGLMDYGRTAAMTDEQILAMAPTESHPGQPIGWAPGDNVTGKLAIVVRPDGYSVYQK